MRILVFNAGSSSLKFGIFDLGLADSRVFKAEFVGFSADGCELRYRIGGEAADEQAVADHVTSLEAAVRKVPAVLATFGFGEFAAVGHRVVHGGDRFRAATLIDDEVEHAIDECGRLAPLHNPVALAAIRLSRQLWPRLPQVAVFDTAFHQTIPDYAYTYAVPDTWRQHGLRRYGFHGTSHHYVALRAAAALRRPMDELRLISCHLGNGASVCAVQHGRSVDTSMGMTPLEGLVMGTRSGDIDPGAFSFLARELGLDANAIEHALNHDSGLLALAGTQDMQQIAHRAEQGDVAAQLALRVFAYRVRKYIGAYAAVMGGVDAVIFTGGIGENSAELRRRICERLEFLGLLLDDDRNRQRAPADFGVLAIHGFDSRVQVLVTRTNEQYMIACEVQLLLVRPQPGNHVHIPVAVSARHVHLSQAAVEALFGAGHQLQLDHKLSQPEGWAARETVAVIGPKGGFDHVRVLGPTRVATQIEVSRTDTFTLGLDAPLRPSGQLKDTPLVKLRGPAGELITDGLIVAARHIHMSPADADALHLRDGDYVDMKVGSDDRAVDFTHTLIRVKPDFVTEMHIDTDEANAAGIRFCTTGELVLDAERPPATVAGRTRSG
ncbi:MAG TPA: acetate/propionate family kinase [Candidatus Acidoferrum sp.]|nr:acetate/propionate family kinase [Candidatus Acidoferrum sp.]